MKKEKIIWDVLSNTGKSLKETLGDETVIKFKEETDKKAGTKFTLEVVLKR